VGDGVKLVLFDVDGTVLDNVGADDARYLRAFATEFGITEIDTDWSHYPHATDSCIARVLLAGRFGREATDAEIGRARDAYVVQLLAAAEAGEEVGRPTRGVAAAFEALGAAGWRAGLATGGWRASALFKLSRSGLDVSHLPGAFADDHLSREGITSIAKERAESAAGRAAERVVYVGDAIWDLKASAALGLPFVGIAKGARADGLRAAGASVVLGDFADAAAFVDALDRAAPAR
jgi:phosphoglycolate phosphatase-like HAD superfamily hydrolase